MVKGGKAAVEASRRARRDRRLFDRIADDYSRKDLLPAHRRARRLRLIQTLRHTGIDESADLLEIGCGAGFAADDLRGRFRSFHGIDHSTRLVDLANEINGGPGVSFATADASTLSLDRRFDVIFMIGVLHHLPDPEASLRHLKSLLKADGVIAVNEPHNGNPAIQLARRIRKRTDSHYSDDQTTFSGAGIRAVFEGAGFDLTTLRPQGLLSTPFAEVVMPAQTLVSPLSSIACAMDRIIEAAAPWALRYLSWNLIAVAKPRRGAPHPASDSNA